jgi:hypothetical protein
MQVLMDLARTVGYYTIQEPNNHIRPEEIKKQPALSEEYNQHADILLLKHDEKLYIDVAITRPTNITNLSKDSTLTTPLISTHRRATQKICKYKEIAAVNNYELIPFVMETYGGIGKAAASLLKRMSQHSREYSPKEFLEHAHARLSICLQSSNANLVLLSMQQLSTSLHLAKKQMHKTSYGYSKPVSSNLLQVQLEKQMNGLDVTYERRVGDSINVCAFDSNPPSPSPSHFSSSAPSLCNSPPSTPPTEENNSSSASSSSSSPPASQPSAGIASLSPCSSSASTATSGTSYFSFQGDPVIGFDYTERMYQGDYD